MSLRSKQILAYQSSELRLVLLSYHMNMNPYSFLANVESILLAYCVIPASFLNFIPVKDLL